MDQDTAKASSCDDKSKALRDQLALTRSALAAKLDALQKRMTRSVDTACDTVDETVLSAKLSALDAAHSIKHLMNPKQQFARHPWMALSIAACIGGALAKRVSGLSHLVKHLSESALRSDVISNESESSDQTATKVDARPLQTNLKQWVNLRIKSELLKLQGAAIGAGVNIVRGLVNRLLPPSDDQKHGQ